MSHRVAIIGAGIGAEHLHGYRQLPGRFDVTTVCDLSTDRAESLVGGHQAISVTDSLDDVLGDAAIDVVDICLPPHLHFEVATRALDAGKDVVCEKPLVCSLRDMDRLIAKSEATGRSVFPVFQYRYGKAASQLRALKDAGLTGKPFVGTLETHWNRGVDYYDVGWRGTWAGEQGGAVLGHAIHLHDWLSYALGPVKSVFADTATRVNDIEFEDCAALSIRMENGALVTSSVTLGAANDTSRMRFIFEGLTAESGRAPYAPADDVWTYVARSPFEQSAIESVLAKVADCPSGFAGLFEAVADTLDGNPGHEVTLLDARRSVEFVTAIYASARANAPVDLPLGEDHPLYAGWLP